MRTIKLSRRVLGYRKIEFDKKNQSEIVRLIFKKRVQADFISDTSFVISERDFLILSKSLRAMEKCSVSAPLGLFGRLRGVKHKIAIVIALMTSLLIILLASNIVWDVRIEGYENYPSCSIMYALEECGLGVGAMWSEIDKSMIESRILDEHDDISWININRRGTVAYVSFKYTEPSDDNGAETETAYANIVSKYDCVIEDIIVDRGTAMVKVGDVIKAGDVLISGITSNDGEGVLCRASGTVIGRIDDVVSVDVQKKYSEKELKKESIASLKLKIFGFPLNIFNFYGNLTAECDIIIDKAKISLCGDCDLPIEIIKIYKTHEEILVRELDTSELVKIASRKISAATASKLKDADLLGIKTSGSFTLDGYSMVSEITYLKDVGSEMPFEID